jgi:hypothetical protein
VIERNQGASVGAFGTEKGFLYDIRYDGGLGEAEVPEAELKAYEPVRMSDAAQSNQ